MKSTNEQLEEIIFQAYIYGSYRYRQGLAIARQKGVGEVTDEMMKQWGKLIDLIMATQGTETPHEQ